VSEIGGKGEIRGIRRGYDGESDLTILIKAASANNAFCFRGYFQTGIKVRDIKAPVVHKDG